MGRLQKSLASLQKKQARFSDRKTVKAPAKIEKKEIKDVVHSWSDGLRTAIPYRPDAGLILLVGDGDLSFARSLVQSHGLLSCVVPTVYEPDRAQFAGVHGPVGIENLDALTDAGVHVLFGTDACKLASFKRIIYSQLPSYIGPVSRIVFNFPHTGDGIKDRDHNIRVQQQMLSKFFVQAADLISDKRQKCWITRRALSLQRRKSGVPNLCRSFKKAKNAHGSDDSSNSEAELEQSGELAEYMEPEIHVTLWQGDPYDDWNVRSLALSCGKLELKESFSFAPGIYPLYKHCRTAGSSAAETTFQGREARTYVFVLKSRQLS